MESFAKIHIILNMIDEEVLSLDICRMALGKLLLSWLSGKRKRRHQILVPFWIINLDECIKYENAKLFVALRKLEMNYQV